MSYPRWRRPVVALALLGFVGTATRAVAPIGTFGVATTVGFSNATFDFQPPVGGGTGSLTVAGGATGSFMALSATSATALDLTDATSPVGTAVAIDNWLIFAADPNTTITLLRLQSGNFSSASCFAPPAAGQSCTPPAAAGSLLSSLNLANITASSSTVLFTVRGNAVNEGTNEQVGALGTFAFSFPTTSYQSFLATIAAGGTVTASGSGAFEASQTVPVALQSFEVQ